MVFLGLACVVTGWCCVVLICVVLVFFFFFFQAEDGIRDLTVTGVQTCALPIYHRPPPRDVRGARGRGEHAMKPMFQGSIVALVTPFRDGVVDEAKLRELVDFQVANGTDGVVPCGTTGESPTLSHEEHRRVVAIVVQAARGRLAVIAGTGSNSTREAIELTRHAKATGANGALLVNPYYNRPTQEGLYRHFRARADSVDIPT